MLSFKMLADTMADALISAGMEGVVRDFPDGGKKRYSRPVVAVGVKAGTGFSAGFKEYLGEKFRDDLGAWVELYGFRLDLTFGLSIYSPKGEPHGAAGCQLMLDRLSEAAGKLPDGLKVRSLSFGEVSFDQVTGMFLCQAQLECAAFLYVEMDEDGEFLDFMLKGVLKNG